MDTDAWNGMYRLLHQLGYPRPTIRHTGPKGKGKLQVAWPERKVGIAVTELDDPGPFRRDGWEIISVNLRQLSAIGPLVGMLDTLSFAHRLSASRIDAKSTVSKTEQNLLRELLRLGMPEPDRNINIVDDESGQVLTVPDFAWEKGAARLAVFVDGYYFHGGMDRHAILEIAANDPVHAAHLEQSERDKLTRDANARRYMTARGWTVIAVTDTEIDDPEERIRSATEIRDAWTRLNGQTSTATPYRPHSPTPPAAATPAAPANDADRSTQQPTADFEVPAWAQ